MSAAGEPTPSPLPFRPKSPAPAESNTTTFRPHPKHSLPRSKLRIICQDLNHSGADVFFNNCTPSTAFSKAVEAVLSTLYEPTKTNDHIPPTRSITVTLRSMDGVAYTTGSELDDDHKEIHFSLDYINGISSRKQLPREEIQGVLVHEMVHCWQWNALGTAPGGLIEGIADFVRLKAGLSPPHWKREGGGSWDAGYQHTGYFLEWMENQWGEGTVRKVNGTLRNEKYVEEEFWEKLFGNKVEDLWKDYSEGLKEKNGEKKGATENSCSKDEDEEAVEVAV
ncbi:hypothetical protein MMC28_008094 [Mycoblastus sanguinarius]|nr:hypothetical protein [Mycoblastus sanguinarius]